MSIAKLVNALSLSNSEQPISDLGSILDVSPESFSAKYKAE